MAINEDWDAPATRERGANTAAGAPASRSVRTLDCRDVGERRNGSGKIRSLAVHYASAASFTFRGRPPRFGFSEMVSAGAVAFGAAFVRSWPKPVFRANSARMAE